MRFPEEVREVLVVLHGEEFVQKLEKQKSRTPATAPKSIFADWQPDLTDAKPHQRSATAKAASKPRHMLAMFNQ